MNAYHIVTLKYDEAKPVFDLLAKHQPDKAIDYLAQWDYGGESEHGMSFCKNFKPTEFRKANYYMSVFKPGASVSLFRITKDKTWNNILFFGE